MATGGMVTDQSTPMHPATAHTLTRLLRQQGNEKAAKAVAEQQGYRW